VLAQFVRVHHGAAATDVAARHDGALARQLLALDLRDAEAALLARDESHYRAALADAQELLKVDFDPGADAVTAARTALGGLAKVVLAPPPPSVLGAALKDLRNLRATHALRQSPRPAEIARPVEPAKPPAKPAAPAEPGEGQQ
jgi:uroporphyrin-3 C-methyltransferase